MNLFKCPKRPKSYVRLGRAILRLQDIKDVVQVAAFGQGVETAIAPFKLKINMKYGDNIEIEFQTWTERAECVDFLWGKLKDLR